jgi:hypothetical protein
MPRSSKSLSDPNLLEAALEGLLLQKQRLEAQIQDVRVLLGKRKPGSHTAESNGVSGRRELSDAARKRIATAQKKRWAEYRKQHKAE